MVFHFMIERVTALVTAHSKANGQDFHPHCTARPSRKDNFDFSTTCHEIKHYEKEGRESPGANQ